MVNARERGFDKTQPKAKGYSVKNSKSNSLRTQQAIARFGKSALHPLCQAALKFWQINAEFSALTKRVKQTKQLVSELKQKRKDTAALINRFYKAHKQKEAAQAASIMQRLDNELLPGVQKSYEAAVTLWLPGDFDHNVASALFESELDVYKRDNQAKKALRRTQKRWEAITNGRPLKASDGRSLGILRMLRDKLIKGAWAKGGPPAGYFEAARAGSRPLSDDALQGRLTAREIHSHIKATEEAGVAGNEDAKEIRRDAKKLGIRLAEDQRGRKQKPPYPKKQEAKRPRGRPREKPELVYSADFTKVEKDFVRSKLSRRVETVDSWKGTYKAIAQIDISAVKDARGQLRKIDREIEKLTIIRAGRKGRYVY
jgi:hypothetical protein